MPTEQLPSSLHAHRIRTTSETDVSSGRVRYSPIKSLWFLSMLLGAIVGAIWFFSWTAFAVFVVCTASVLLFGHSLGSHRKFIHNSYECPRWLERWLVWMGVQVGLAGPLGLLAQHELRDYAQRLPECHPYLRHGSSPAKDAWWQLHCELQLDKPPALRVEERLSGDRFYAWLERTWMLQQLPPALLLYACGGWGFVLWGVCARVTAGVFGHWLIGYFAHNRGEMHFHVDDAAVQGRNIRWTSLLTMGESWHNNHHAYPGSARLGLRPGEWDPGWWTLMALYRVGLVWNLRLPADLPERSELRALGDAPLAAKSVHEVPSLTGLWRQATIAAPDGVFLDYPSTTAPLWLLRAMVGPRVHIRTDRGVARLRCTVAGHAITGLPGLWLAMAVRSRWNRMGLLATIPLAVGLERLRNWFAPPLPAYAAVLPTAARRKGRRW